MVNKYRLISYLQAGEITRRLQEEEEAAMGSANAIKKLDAEIKRSKEEVENMDLRRVIYSRVQKSIENWSVWSKMALGEVGVSLS